MEQPHNADDETRLVLAVLAWSHVAFLLAVINALFV